MPQTKLSDPRLKNSDHQSALLATDESIHLAQSQMLGVARTSDTRQVPPLDTPEFARLINYSEAGVYRLIKEKRLPEGTTFKIGSKRAYCPQRTAAIASGELKILSIAEAKSRSRGEGG